MSTTEKADSLFDRGADGLEELSRKAAAKGGVAAKLADELADSAQFLRKLKPTLVKERAKGNAATPTDQQPRVVTGFDGSSAAAPQTTPAEAPVVPPPVVPPPPPSEAATPVPEAEPVVAPPPVTAEVAAPSPAPTAEPKRKGLNPFVVAGVALMAGIVLAKVIDWRSHAHPRD